MSFTTRELWTIVHGMGLGAAFLLAFAGGLAGLWSLRPGLITEAGIVERTKRLKIGTWAMALAAWLTVITGTFIVYPWYRADTGACEEELTAGCGARFALLADEAKAQWHEFGMEWKEHIAWIAPMLATAVAVAVSYYGVKLVREQGVKKALIVAFSAAFVIAAIAGALGAFITKSAPVA
ncbi:MAG: hypothetical protein WD757_00245 [Actinomycetota bacterium]